ncbi:EcsC family protein [Brevibacillus laterosporus]|uniref:EcsC family protein n=1 Tax=Brevibacillus laterosporus TaxID=1465 RepID=UPI0003B2175A|nr:EcsC family protein [Brevibacillus laterosporus]AYK08246.1 EcsC family protein [Brevibacillus laterosporus]ERM18301.1 hypothetical protein P615_17095 [Brevibacillus laterosporus PE36]
MESVEELQQQFRSIEIWEQEQKDLWFWEKIGRLPFVYLDRAVPKSLKEKVGDLLNELGAYIQTGGKYLIRNQDVWSRFSNPPHTLEQVQMRSLQEMDQVALQLAESRTNVAMVQGATTGFGGMFTLAIDIPVIIGLSLKVLQEMALTYGFDPHDKVERIFIIKCLQFTSADVVGKKAILAELSTFDEGEKHQEIIAQLQGWREVSLTYMDSMAWKKLFQLIPIVGMFFGAFTNRTQIADIAMTGQMLYKKRRILQRLAEQNSEKL